MGLEEDFEKAAEEATTLLPSSLPNKNQLELYSLFKQAKFGDNDTPKPGFLDLKGKAKWEAWSEQKGKTKEEAMQAYIEKVEELKQEYNVQPNPAT